MSENTDLPALPMWQARSFWLQIIGAVTAIGAATGFDLLGHLGVPNEGALADHVMQVVSVVAFALSWRERRAPNYRLTLRAK